MRIIGDGECPEWDLAMEKRVELDDGSMLFPFIPHQVIRTQNEIVDYTYPNFAAIQCYSPIGRHLLSAANKYDLDQDWKVYDKIFIPHRHFKTGVKIEEEVDVWVAGLTRHDDGECKLVFKLLG